MTNEANSTMSPAHQVINVEGGVTDPGLDDRRAVRGRRPGAARTNRPPALHSPSRGRDAGRSPGQGRDGGERDRHQARDHPGGGGRGHRMRHDGGADQPPRFGAPGRPAGRPHRHRGGRPARPHGQRWSQRPRRLARAAGGASWTPGTAFAPATTASSPSTRSSIAARTSATWGRSGAGNHFIEVCLDEEDHVWFVLHSGSRGVGNRIGSYFIELAKEDMRRWFVNLPDQDLAYLPEGTEHFDDYVEAVHWAQEFARINRELMMAGLHRRHPGDREAAGLRGAARGGELPPQLRRAREPLRRERPRDPQGRGAGAPG